MFECVLVHLGGFGFEVLVEGDFEGEEFLAVGGAEFAEVEGCAFEGVGEAGDVVEEEAGLCGVGFDDESLVLELVEVLFDVFVAGFGLEVDGGEWAGEGDFGALFVVEADESLNVFGVGGLDAVALGGDEDDAGVLEGDGLVAEVGDDEADGDDAVGEVVDAEEGGFVVGVVGLGGDGEMLVGVDFNGGEVSGGLDGRGFVVCGAGGGR